MNRLKKNYKEYLFVLLGWILLGAIILLFSRGMAEGLSVWGFVQLYCTNFFLFLVILYLNSIVLLPRLYYNNKKILYFIVLTIIGASVVFYFKPFDNLIHEVRVKTRPYWEKKFLEHARRDKVLRDSVRIDERHFSFREMERGRGDRRADGVFSHSESRPDLVSLMVFLFLVGSGFAVESNRRLALSEQKRLLAESEKTKAELSFLKAQINPHFLFNTLNNIYSMALMQKEETPDAVMRLSNIMRYVTESSDMEYIGLEDEIDFIADYIFLNELKAGKQLQLDFQVNGDPKGKEIAPLLLISFIENAFKYGISKREPSPILIRMDISDGLLRMEVANKIFLSKDKMTENTGVGIENTRKRLATLYTGKYRLDIEQKENEFRINLEVPLV